MVRTSFPLRATLTAAALLMFALPAAAQTTSRASYGCFRVTAESLNIRDKAFASGAVIGTAKKGDILVKRKRFCTLRGYWCGVSFGTTEGWADKAFMEAAPCPPTPSSPSKS